MPESTIMTERAFNAGCDARLAGEPFHRCPYYDIILVAHWRRGWMDVHRYWGCCANLRRRRPHALPEATGPEKAGAA